MPLKNRKDDLEEMEKSKKQFFLNNRVLKKNKSTGKLSLNVGCDGFNMEYLHKKWDPDGVNRLYIKTDELNIELFPSKGLTVGEIFYLDKPVLWEPLLSSLPDPQTVDLNRQIKWNNQIIDGLSFIESFVGGIIMFGLSNWGMPYRDKKTDKLYTLHGEVSNIPMKDLKVCISGTGLEVSGDFIVRNGVGDGNEFWYTRGEDIYLVAKKVIVDKDIHRITISDRIKNISKKPLLPDWGYSIKFHPEEGIKYLVPSDRIENRFGSSIDNDHEIWKPAHKESVREERGIIHKGLKESPGILCGNDGVEMLLLYQDGSGILIVLPRTSYFLSWYSAGGRGSEEFLMPSGGRDMPLQVFSKNWDGLGPEFGNSNLNHDGNTDPDISVNILEPGDELKINIILEFISKERVRDIARRIREYNQKRIKV